jgi:ubiquinone/menaquinone biosynthesis C-methylase UbiE
LPCESIVEIATGHGRWTRFLAPRCKNFVGFDLVEKCTHYCEKMYFAPGRSFITNDGLHLTGVADHSVDFVFSMDSLVHVDWATLQSYLAETLRVLKPSASAMIHHSNAAAVEGFNELTPPSRKGFRASDCSAKLVREHVERLGGGVQSQEIVDWGQSGTDFLIDCFSTIVAHRAETKIVENPDFMKERGEILRAFVAKGASEGA